MNRALPSLSFLFAASLHAGTAMEGVTFIPGYNNAAVLMGPDGTTLKSWTAAGSSYAAFLTEAGSVVYSTGQGTGPGAPYKSLAEVDWDGASVNTWTWTSPGTGTLHHAHAVMPNGHWLALGYESLTNAQVLAATGESSITYTGSVYDEHILEYDPVSKTVVWEWDAKKHFSASANPRKINVNKFASGGGPMGGGSGDVLHFNSVAYDPVRDLVVVSAHMLNEILVIDHSTTTAEAATNSGGKRGKGGQILFRWGAPQNYGGTSSTVCNVIHGANTVPAGYSGAGNFLFFCNSDNGVLDAASKGRSKAYEIQPQVADSGFVLGANGEFAATVAWSWFRSGTDYANYASSGNFGFVQALPNGNRFISFSKSKRLVEISEGAVVKEITGCSNDRVRASRYPLDYRGISRTSVYQTTGIAGGVGSSRAFHASSDALGGQLLVEGLQAGEQVSLRTLQGRTVAAGRALDGSLRLPIAGLPNGSYVLQASPSGRSMGLGLFH